MGAKDKKLLQGFGKVVRFFSVVGILILGAADTSKGQSMQNRPGSDEDRWKGLYVRKDEGTVEATEADKAVEKSYPEWGDKGQVIESRRLTIMTKKQTHRVNDKVRIIHVLEAVDPGYRVYVMGPKRVFDEYVKGQLQGETTPSDQADPFKPAEYNGRILDSPATDFNFEVTTYSFAAPGTYEICWRPGKWKSNTLEIKVGE
jgi:hypothetical protein